MVPLHLEVTSSAALSARGDSLLLDEVEAKAAEVYALSWIGRLIRESMCGVDSKSIRYEIVERTISHTSFVLRWATFVSLVAASHHPL